MCDGPAPTDSHNQRDDNKLTGSLQNNVKDFKKVDSLSIGVVNGQMEQSVKIWKAENNKPRKCGDFGLVIGAHDDLA